jgi:hypothetical protein
MKLYYMRDNHTFRELPLDIDGAIAGCREEFHAGYTSGMLCKKPDTFPPTKDSSVHAMSDWSSFEDEARDWLEKVLTCKRCDGTGVEALGTPYDKPEKCECQKNNQ